MIKSMLKKKTLLLVGAIIGIIIILISTLSMFNPIVNFIKLSEKENDAYNNPFNGSDTKTYNLDSGNYYIYYHSNSYNNPGFIILKDPNDNIILSETQFRSNQDLTIMERKYYKVKSFNAEIDGDYSVFIENPGVILILEKGFFIENIFSIILYVILLIVGILVFIICFLFLIFDFFNDKKKKENI